MKGKDDIDIPGLFSLYNQQFIDNLHSKYEEINIKVLTEKSYTIINDNNIMEVLVDEAFNSMKLNYFINK